MGYQKGLEAAIINNNLDLVIKLLDEGASIHQTDAFDNSLLAHAAMAGKSDIVSYLINQKLDVNAQNQRGDTPLMLAAWNGHISCVQILLSNDADTSLKNQHGETCLMVAIVRGHREIVKLLLENGADISIKNNHNQSAINIATTFNNVDILTLLKERQHSLEVQKKTELDIDQYLMKCNTQIQRLKSLKNNIALSKAEILKAAKLYLENGSLSPEDKLNQFTQHIKANKEALQKPHSSISKNIMKGLVTFIGYVLGVLPGLFLQDRFFGPNRITTTYKEIVEPLLELDKNISGHSHNTCQQ